MSVGSFILIFVAYCLIGFAVDFLKAVIMAKYALKVQREKINDATAQISRAIIAGLLKWRAIKKGGDNVE